MKHIGLYIHIPFCETKCPYCDFNTYSGIDNLIPKYIDALCNEIQFWGNNIGDMEIDTIFLGGGTPSYLPEKYLVSIVETLNRSFNLSSNIEFTIEVNPGDITKPSPVYFPKFGINRVSIGVQSLDDSILKVLGRRHNSSEASKAFKTLRGYVDNISIDLMYGITYQTMAQWEDTLNKVIQLDPDHLSVYCLTLEQGTPMERYVSIGQLPDPDPDLAADMYLKAEKLLYNAGYIHYEISNWSKPGMESKHNLKYWLNENYIGVGPGAHSHMNKLRFFNIKSPREYIKACSDFSFTSSKIDFTEIELSNMSFIGGFECIDEATEISETLMLGLRLDSGINKTTFKLRFGKDIYDVYGNQITELLSANLLTDTGDILKLTPSARLLANEVFVRFFEK